MMPDRRVLVVTGLPGVGKSALLGRVVTTADPQIAAVLPPGDAAVRARVGSVACAVHAKGKTALEVAGEVARAASAALPGEPDDLAPAVRAVLEQHAGSRFSVIIDALDEAAGPDQARLIIATVVLPLAETCADAGAQVMVGTRRRDDGGDLLDRFGGARTVIDLDDPGYFAEQDLAGYALACLQLAGDERPASPYNDLGVAGPVAARIAALSGQNFLIAGLIARSHGLHDEHPVDPARLAFEPTVDAALTAYLQRLPPAGMVPAIDALTALAFAEAPGLPAGLWQLAIETLDGTLAGAGDLARFARSSAASFLVETGHTVTPGAGGEAGGPVYRLFHQALNDALLRHRADVMPRAGDERALTRAFLAAGRRGGWQNVPGYLLRALPGHAQAAGMADDLLADDRYLLHADLRRLLPVAGQALTPDGRRRARLLQLTSRAITAGPAECAALFSVTEALDGLGDTYRTGEWNAPYTARWAVVRARTERAVLEGHRNWVDAVCPVTVAGQPLLASGGGDRTVRIWDPATGEQRAMLEGHQGAVDAVCPVTVAGQALLASGGADGTVRIWDPATGQQRAVLDGHQGGVRAVCPVTVAGQALLASGGDRSHGADLGPRHRAAAGGAGRPPGPGEGGVPGQRGRPGPAGQRRRRSHGADLGPRHRAAAGGAGRPPARGGRGVPGHRGRRAPAGQRRRRWHGADLGPRHRAAAGRCWKATSTGCTRCARSPWPARPCWPAAAAIARCGSGTPPPGSSGRCWTATRARWTRCARSPWPARPCWPAAAPIARCGSGTPPPGSSGPCWTATRAR